MSFGLYILGYTILICGLLYVAHLLHVPQQWIVAFGIILVGMGILAAVKNNPPKGSA